VKAYAWTPASRNSIVNVCRWISPAGWRIS